MPYNIIYSSSMAGTAVRGKSERSPLKKSGMNSEQGGRDGKRG